MRLTNQISGACLTPRAGREPRVGKTSQDATSPRLPTPLARGLLPRLTVHLQRPHPSGAETSPSAPRRCAALVRDRGVVEHRRGRGRDTAAAPAIESAVVG